MQLSSRAREAIKTAVAMTAAYGIALWLDWGNPSWAATAVGAVSLSSIGQSFNKAAMRMAGTLLAGLVALIVIGLFPQERWLFALAIFSWVGLCTYLMMGPRQQYFWQVSGFVAAIVCVGSAGDLDGAFGVAVLRLQETGLGILVYSLVSVFLWPVSSAAGFEGELKALITRQRSFCLLSLGGQQGEPDGQPAPALLAQMTQTRTQVAQLFEAAATDSYAVEAERERWARVVAAAGVLGDALRRFQDAADDLVAVPEDGLVGLQEFRRHVDARFDVLERLLDGDVDATQAQNAPTLRAHTELELTHLQRAAVTVLRERCERIHAALENLVEAALALRTGAGPEAAEGNVPKLALLDPDRLAAALRASGICWFVYVLWIYVEALPGGAMAVTFAAVFAMAAASMPQLPLRKILEPGMTGIALASLVTIFLMPLLDGFLALGTVIFGYTFFICYYFAEPTQALGRLFGLAMFAVIANITNDQSYSFLAMANTALMFVIVLLAIAVSAYFPLSLQPADSFARLVRRFFRCAELLVKARRGAFGNTPMERWRLRLARAEVARLPTKLAAWALPTAGQLGVAPGELQALQRALQALADDLQAFAGVERLSPALRDACDLPSWQQVLERSLALLQADPQGAALAAQRERLAALAVELEERVDQVMALEPDAGTDAALYRALGAYRSVARSMLAYLRVATAIDRAAWLSRAFP